MSSCRKYSIIRERHSGCDHGSGGGWRKKGRAGKEGGSVCVCVGGIQRLAHSSLPKLYISSALRLSYDGFSSACILRGILLA